MKRIKQNSLWAIAGGGIPALVALIAVPVLMYQLGYEIFAITSLIISLTIFFYIYDFGIGRSLTFYTPQPQKRTSISISELVGSGIFISLLVGTFASLIVYYSAPYLAGHWISIGKEFSDSSSLAFQIASLGILPSVLSNTFKGILEGQSRFRESSLCKIFSGVTLFLAPLGLVLFGNTDVVDISIGIVSTRYAALGLYLIYLSHVVDLKLISIRFFALRTLYRYGFWAAISGFISTMFVYGDRFVAAHYLDAEQLSIYVASQDLLIRYLLIPWSTAIVLMPIFSANTETCDDIRQLYRKHKRQAIGYALGFLFLIVTFAIVLIPMFGSYKWPAMTTEVVVIQAVGVFFCALSQLPLIYLYANDKPRLITLIYLVEGGLYLIFAPLVFEKLGLIGACVMWSCRLVVEFLSLRYFAERLLNVRK
jgi:O-antigen/teichoic acid export membrane protein